MEESITSHETHTGPGRRFAKGTTRGDHILGAFGFLAHAAFFTAVATGVCWASPRAAKPLCIATGVLSAVLLAVRARQVGSSTTKESIQALKDAWR